MTEECRKGSKNSLIDSIVETIESLGVEIGDEIEDSLRDMKGNWKVVGIWPKLGETWGSSELGGLSAVSSRTPMTRMRSAPR